MVIARNRKAWQTFGQIVSDPKMVFGGANTMLTTNFGNSGDPLFKNPPGCYMHHQASFITDFFTKNNPNVKPGEDFDFLLSRLSIRIVPERKKWPETCSACSAIHRRRAH